MIINIKVEKNKNNYYVSAEINNGLTLFGIYKEQLIESIKNDCKKLFGSEISFYIEEVGSKLELSE